MKKYIICLILAIVFSPSYLLSYDETLANEIKSLNRAVSGIQSDLALKEQLLSSETDREKILELQRDINRLRDKQKTTTRTLDNLLANSNIFIQEEDKNSTQGLTNDVQEVLAPVIQNFKRMSAKPRKIEKLRTQLQDIEEKTIQIDTAIKNVDDLSRAELDQELLEAMQASKLRMLDLKKGLSAEQRNVQKMLDDELRGQENIWQAGSSFVRKFLGNKGKHIFLAFLASVLVFGFLILIKNPVLRPVLKIKSFATVYKPIMALYNALAGIMAVVSALLCLFLLNDWFLFTTFLLLIGLVLWAFKHMVLNFIDAVRVVLDLGTVKEGERLTFNGSPWLVKKTGLRTQLVNDELSGGEIKVSIAMIKDLVSRPVIQEEPWFPTRKGNYVILDDGTYGKILVQTPEQVVINVEDYTRKFYTLTNFIAQKPLNLSDGFIITTKVKVNYKHQKEILKIVDKIKNELDSVLECNELIVQLGEMADDSLNIVVKVYYSGELAPRYLELNRTINSTIVSACNKMGLNIPLKQLSVHMDK